MLFTVPSLTTKKPYSIPRILKIIYAWMSMFVKISKSMKIEMLWNFTLSYTNSNYFRIINNYRISCLFSRFDDWNTATSPRFMSKCLLYSYSLLNSVETHRIFVHISYWSITIAWILKLLSVALQLCESQANAFESCNMTICKIESLGITPICRCTRRNCTFTVLSFPQSLGVIVFLFFLIFR